jgi:hypothetical protein
MIYKIYWNYTIHIYSLHIFMTAFENQILKYLKVLQHHYKFVQVRRNRLLQLPVYIFKFKIAVWLFGWLYNLHSFKLIRLSILTIPELAQSSIYSCQHQSHHKNQFLYEHSALPFVVLYLCLYTVLCLSCRIVLLMQWMLWKRGEHKSRRTGIWNTYWVRFGLSFLFRYNRL